jgi:hypothetical protein
VSVLGLIFFDIYLYLDAVTLAGHDKSLDMIDFSLALKRPHHYNALKIFTRHNRFLEWQFPRRGMASSAQFLEEQFKLLQLSTPIPSTYPDTNPIDFFKIHIANSVARILNLDATTVFPALQRPQGLDKGDLVCLHSSGNAPLSFEGSPDSCPQIERRKV